MRVSGALSRRRACMRLIREACLCCGPLACVRVPLYRLVCAQPVSQPLAWIFDGIYTLLRLYFDTQIADETRNDPRFQMAFQSWELCCKCIDTVMAAKNGTATSKKTAAASFSPYIADCCCMPPPLPPRCMPAPPPRHAQACLACRCVALIMIGPRRPNRCRIMFLSCAVGSPPQLHHTCCVH